MCLLPVKKTLFLSDEETWTFLNAESDTDHEPPGREVELKYINTNCRKIMHHLQSHWNMCKENWFKLKEMYCRIQTNQQRCQLRGIWPSKSLPSYSHMYMTYKKVWTVKTIICNQQKTLFVCHLSIFSSLLISCMPVSTLMAIIHTLFSDNKRTPSYVILGWDIAVWGS